MKCGRSSGRIRTAVLHASVLTCLAIFQAFPATDPPIGAMLSPVRLVEVVAYSKDMIAGQRRASSGLRPPRDAVRRETGRGDIAFWIIAPHLYVTEVRGHMTPALSTLIIERANPLYVRANVLYGVHNWLGMTNYDSACRVDLTAWIMRHKAQSVLHIGTASRMVAMGVMVAKVALGDLLHVHADADALERTLTDIQSSPR